MFDAPHLLLAVPIIVRVRVWLDVPVSAPCWCSAALRICCHTCERHAHIYSAPGLQFAGFGVPACLMPACCCAQSRWSARWMALGRAGGSRECAPPPAGAPCAAARLRAFATLEPQDASFLPCGRLFQSPVGAGASCHWALGCGAGAPVASPVPVASLRHCSWRSLSSLRASGAEWARE